MGTYASFLNEQQTNNLYVLPIKAEKDYSFNSEDYMYLLLRKGAGIGKLKFRWVNVQYNFNQKGKL